MSRSPVDTPFVGREAELGELEAGLAAAMAGSPTICFVSGEAGIGKTRICAALAERAAASGARVLVGQTPIGADELPYAPLVAALRPGLAAVAGAQEHPARAYADALAYLFPELGIPAGIISPDLARLRLFEAMRGLIATLAEPAGLMLVVEDAHWADRSTLDVLGYLAVTLASERVLLLVTHRRDLPPEHRLHGLLAEATRNRRVGRVALGPLEPAPAQALAAALLDDSSGSERLARIVRLGEGNPLFIGELAKVPDGGTPVTLEELVLARWQGLPQRTRDLLRICAAAGRSVDVALLSAVTGASAIEVADGLRPAIDAGLLDRTSVLSQDLAFRHVLTQEVVYRQSLPAERADIHRALAAALEGCPGVNDEIGPAAALAMHWARSGDATRAFPAVLRAADLAETAYAFAEAGAFLRTAVALWPQVAERPRAEAAIRAIGFAPTGRHVAALADLSLAGLCRRAAEAAALAGDLDAALELLDQALGSGPSERQALVIRGRRAALTALARGPEAALPDFEAVAGLVADSAPSPETVRIAVDHARAAFHAGHSSEARALATAALERARALGVVEEEGRALMLLGAIAAGRGEREEAGTRLAEARAADERRRTLTAGGPRPSRVGDILGQRLDSVRLLMAIGRQAEAVDAALEAAGEAGRLGADRTWGRQLGSSAAVSLFDLGRWDEADREAEEALTAGAAPASIVAGLTVRGRIAGFRGQAGRAQQALDSAAAMADGLGDPALRTQSRTARAELALLRHQPAEAWDEAERALATAVDPGLRVAPLLVALAAAADALALTAGHGGERASDRQLALLAEAQLVERDLEPAGDPLGRARRLALRAESARVMRRDDGDLWASASEAWAAAGVPHQRAAALIRCAEADLARGGDRARARSALLEARRVALALSATALDEEVLALARRARLDLAEGTEPSAGAVAEGERLGLSEREFEVLLLVAEGLTNRQIAERLFITEKTAGHHVSAILGKFGVASRVEAASLAYRSGVVGDPPRHTT